MEEHSHPSVRGLSLMVVAHYSNHLIQFGKISSKSVIVEHSIHWELYLILKAVICIRPSVRTGKQNMVRVWEKVSFFPDPCNLFLHLHPVRAQCRLPQTQFFQSVPPITEEFDFLYERI